ncbi:MAG: glycosyltransferase family 39 protein [Anaerolineae bacterium]|nr:glycosyltransferase family 39 protein [Anaerolineae bacterium]
MIPRHRRAWRVLLVLILLLAAALRVVNLGGRAIGYDEAYSVLYAQSWQPEIGGPVTDVHPPLYYGVLRVWMWLVGQSPEGVRTCSVLTGILTVAVVYRLAADLFGRRAARAAALLVAIAPFHVEYSQEARMYALMALWLLLATWCLVRGWRDPRAWRWWVGFAVFAALSMYTQQLAAFYLVALALFPMAARRWDVCGRVIAAGLAALALYLPWLANLAGQIGYISGAYWVPKPDLFQAFRTLFVLTMPFVNVLSLPVFAVAVAVALLAVLSVLLRAYRARAALDWRAGMVLWLAFAPPALMFVVGQFLPIYLQRAMLASALVFYVALACLLVERGVPPRLAGALAALWLATAGFGLALHYTWDTIPWPPFDRAAAYLTQSYGPGDAIVHSDRMTLLPMLYYERALPGMFIADPVAPGSEVLALEMQRALGIQETPCVQAAVRGAARVWFVIYHGREASPSLTWLRDNFAQSDVMAFNDLDVYRFAGPDPAAQRSECPP